MSDKIRFPSTTEIADWAHTARLYLRLRQSAFARMVGASQSTVCRWEAGEAIPEYPTLLAIQALVDERMARNLSVGTDQVVKLATISKNRELLDEIETAYDMLTVLDKTGDGIGGDIGQGVSAVALAARAALDNARSMVRAMGAK